MNAPKHAGWDLFGRDRARLGDMLSEWIAARRWFKSRTRTRVGADVIEVVPVGPLSAAFVRIVFADGGQEVYIVPLAEATGAEAERVRRDDAQAVILDDHDSLVHEAPAAFAEAMIDAMRESRELRGTHAALRGRPGVVDLGGLPKAEVGRAEQTNTAVRFGQRVIMKIYRSTVAGPNPEVEILRFLAREGARHEQVPTPKLAGEVDLVDDRGGQAAVAMAQTFVESRGDAWQATLFALSSLLEQARGAPSDAALAGEIARARKLGARTAALHRALSSPSEDPAFTPEPASPADLSAMIAVARASLEHMVSALRKTKLPDESHAAAARLLAHAGDLDARLVEAGRLPIAAFRTRVHGDYHLGQVLVTPEDDLVIIDFEGEPARSLEERRRKGLAVRDVAGMLRSFDYAAVTALRAAREPERARPWIDAWRRAVSDAFVAAWREGVAGSPAAPADDRDSRALLDLFLIEKAVYEVGYELDHRPTWVSIPIEGLLSLLEAR
ncbi:MAG: putative maltokinase [Deltaproteobacteria bacterium]|nr:putative maltokinase [Deltaproteobacteria bacterium]